MPRCQNQSDELCKHMGLKIVYPIFPMVLLLIIPFLNGYFFGNINPTFSDKATCGIFVCWPEFCIEYTMGCCASGGASGAPGKGALLNKPPGLTNAGGVGYGRTQWRYPHSFLYNVGPPVDSVQLVYNYNFTRVYGRWGYKPTYNVWGPHIVVISYGTWPRFVPCTAVDFQVLKVENVGERLLTKKD